MSSKSDRTVLTVNGELREIDSQSSVADLLEALGIQTRLVAVAVNGTVVPRSELRRQLLVGKDEVEIVRAIGGG